MKQVTITTGKATIVVVDLPIGAFNIKYDHDRVCFDIKDADGVIYPDYRIIPKGNYRHAGQTSQLTEDTWKGIFDFIEVPELTKEEYEQLKSCYEGVDTSGWDYEDETATESGISLLRANGVDDSWINSQIFIKI